MLCTGGVSFGGQLVGEHTVDILLYIAFQIVGHRLDASGRNAIGYVVFQKRVASVVIDGMYLLAVPLQEQAVAQNLIDRRVVAYGIGVGFSLRQRIFAKTERSSVVAQVAQHRG